MCKRECFRTKALDANHRETERILQVDAGSGNGGALSGQFPAKEPSDMQHVPKSQPTQTTCQDCIYVKTARDDRGPVMFTTCVGSEQCGICYTGFGKHKLNKMFRVLAGASYKPCNGPKESSSIFKEFVHGPCVTTVHG